MLIYIGILSNTRQQRDTEKIDMLKDKVNIPGLSLTYILEKVAGEWR